MYFIIIVYIVHEKRVDPTFTLPFTQRLYGLLSTAITF